MCVCVTYLCSWKIKSNGWDFVIKTQQTYWKLIAEKAFRFVKKRRMPKTSCGK